VSDDLIIEDEEYSGSLLNSKEMRRDLGEGVETEDDTAMSKAEKLAAIPEASSAHNTPRRGKRRAETVDEHSQDRAEKLKALHNEGNKDVLLSYLNTAHNSIISNLSSIGFSLGNDKLSVHDAVISLRVDETIKVDDVLREDVKDRALEREEKEMAQEEELDRLILNHICSDIMDEVLDGDAGGNLTASVSSQKSQEKKRKDKNINPRKCQK